MGESGMDNKERTQERSGTGRTASRGGWRVRVAVALMAIVVFLGVLALEVCWDSTFICENTGSRKGYRVWLIGLRSGPWCHESHLEHFMRRERPADLTYRWTRCGRIGRNILGRVRSFRGGFPPLLAIAPPSFDHCVDALDDTGRLDFYRVLAAGDREAIRVEEKKIEEMVLAEALALRQGPAE